MTTNCPVCHKIVEISGAEKAEDTKFSPFCSERCKLIDLGAWLSAEYKIASPPQSEESVTPPGTPSACERE